VGCDVLVWVAGSTSLPFFDGTGLERDDRGFVKVRPTLQAMGHDEIFATGDCATLVTDPRLPKAGVYAVRQGPPLAYNLRAAATGMPLRPYRPQPLALALISTGTRHAVAVWGPIAFEGDWVWRWKDRIDRRFMRRYRVDA